MNRLGKEYSDPITDYINSSIPSWILDLKPCVSGGYALGCMFSSLNLGLIKKLIDDFSIGDYSFNFDDKVLYSIKSKRIANDIDIFFIDNDSFKFSSDYSLDDYTGQINSLSFHSDYMIAERESEHAVTFRKNFADSYSNLPIQFIKKKYSSISRLFSSFDIHNCCIAWKDNQVYVSDDFIRSLYLGEVLFNSNYTTDGEVVSDVFQCLRMMKYRKRYGFDYNREAYNRLLNVYLRLDGYDIEKHSCKVITRDYYGARITEKSYVYNMLNNFSRDFFDITRSNKFRKQDLLYFLGSKNPHIASVVKDKLFLEDDIGFHANKLIF